MSNIDKFKFQSGVFSYRNKHNDDQKRKISENLQIVKKAIKDIGYTSESYMANTTGVGYSLLLGGKLWLNIVQGKSYVLIYTDYGKFQYGYDKEYDLADITLKITNFVNQHEEKLIADRAKERGLSVTKSLIQELAKFRPLNELVDINKYTIQFFNSPDELKAKVNTAIGLLDIIYNISTSQFQYVFNPDSINATGKDFSDKLKTFNSSLDIMTEFQIRLTSIITEFIKMRKI